MELLIVTAAAVIVFLLVEGNKASGQPSPGSAPAPGSSGAAGPLDPSLVWDNPNFDPMTLLGIPNATYNGMPVTDSQGNFIVLGPVRPSLGQGS